eukprot:c18741_g1_i2 orf=367-1299(-)
MWQPVLLAILSAGGSTIGKVLQKKGTKGLPRLSLNLRVMQAYILNCTWGSGFLLDIFGALLMLKAVSQAPISIVQPVSGCGLAVLAVFSHFYLHEAMNPLDWLGVIIAIVGTIGVGMIGEGQRPSELHLKRLIWFIILAVFLFGILHCWSHGRRRRRRARESGGSSVISVLYRSDVMEEAVAGMEAGACFGMAAAASRLGFMLPDRGYSKWCLPVGIVAGICFSGSGFFCQTTGLKEGRAVVVSTCAAIASIVTGVLVGIMALGETLPVSVLGRALLFVGWSCNAYGSHNGLLHASTLLSEIHETEGSSS